MPSISEQKPEPAAATAADPAARIRQRLAEVTSDPGVYLMRDPGGRIIYIGKARNLKKRLLSYFRPREQMDIKTGVLSNKIATFETIVTRTEKEALLLESNLIKKHKPRYNVVLKDDKRYPSLRLDLNHPFPNLGIARKTPEDGALYFGPFASAHAVRQTLKFVNKTFKLRKCKNREFQNRTRPCLHHQMGACPGPCCLPVSGKEYDRTVKEVVLFLNGRTPRLIQQVRRQMATAAVRQDFEKAAALRDKMFALERTLEKQFAVTTDFQDRDVLAVAGSRETALILHFTVRGGYLLGSRDTVYTRTPATDAEVMGTFIRQYYEISPTVPGEILVSADLEDASLLEDWLSEVRGKRVRIHRPRRGGKHRLLQMAVQNAENRLSQRLSQMATERSALSGLAKALKMERPPDRIECFDNSNISGTAAVAAMVTFEKGVPKKSDYRKYRIRGVSGQDDYAYMAEVLSRRYGPGADTLPNPDLLVVDGGKGQLNIAVSVLKRLGVEPPFTIIGIAKKDEQRGETQDKIYLPGRANPVNLGKDERALLLVQRVRDEAHRFAIRYHRSRRGAAALRSVLDDVAGVGKNRKAALLKHFGGIEAIRAATAEQIGEVPGMNTGAARAVKKALSPEPEENSR